MFILTVSLTILYNKLSLECKRRWSSVTNSSSCNTSENVFIDRRTGTNMNSWCQTLQSECCCPCNLKYATSKRFIQDSKIQDSRFKTLYYPFKNILKTENCL